MAIVIADTGIGMSEDEIAIALEPFRQVENTLTKKFEGTGLGLPIARRLVELHGGRLEIASAKNSAQRSAPPAAGSRHRHTGSGGLTLAARAGPSVGQ